MDNECGKYVSTTLLNLSTNVCDNGVSYKIPHGIDSDKFYSIVKEFIDLAKIKGLTIRQAQTLFHVCSEYILDTKFD